MKPDDYAWYKSKGICTYCRHEKADAGYTTCLVCRMHYRENRKNHKVSPEAKEKNRQFHHELYEERKSKGICTKCGKRPLTQPHVLCDYCQAKKRRRDAKRRLKKGAVPRVLFGDGLHCACCGKPTENGAKCCPSCLAKMPSYHGSSTGTGFGMTMNYFYKKEGAKSG